PKNGKSMTPIQVLFNISTIVNAVAVAHLLAHSHFGMPAAPATSLLLAGSAAGFFLVDTVSVAIVIGLAEGASIAQTWKDIVLLSFPYCVLSAGLASMAATAMMFVAWYVPLAMFPVMVLTFASYKLYFVRPARVEAVNQSFVMSAAADD
ncbi:MAG: hypothetical protein ACRD3Q_16055, partial [Terriglobales bacterium]